MDSSTPDSFCFSPAWHWSVNCSALRFVLRAYTRVGKSRRELTVPTCVCVCVCVCATERENNILLPNCVSHLKMLTVTVMRSLGPIIGSPCTIASTSTSNCGSKSHTRETSSFSSCEKCRIPFRCSGSVRINLSKALFRVALGRLD